MGNGTHIESRASYYFQEMVIDTRQWTALSTSTWEITIYISVLLCTWCVADDCGWVLMWLISQTLHQAVQMWNVSCWRLQRQGTRSKSSVSLRHTHRLLTAEILMAGRCLWCMLYWTEYCIYTWHELIMHQENTRFPCWWNILGCVV